MGTGAARAPVYVEFRETGIDEVRRGMRLIRGDAAAAEEGGGRVAHAAQAAASAIAEMAHTGEAGGRGIRELIKSGAEMALTFGVGGPIMGAIGLLGLAFIETFKRAREEIEQTSKKAQEEISAILNSGDQQALLKKARDLYIGTPGDVNAEGRSAPFSGGLDKRRAAIARAQAQVDATREFIRTASFSQGKFLRETLARQLADLKKLQDDAKPYEEEYARVVAAITDPANVARDTAGIVPMKVTAKAPVTAAKALEDQIAALKQLAAAHELTAPDVSRAIQLERTLTLELLNGNKSLEERAKLVDQIGTLEPIAKTRLTLPTLGAVPGVQYAQPSNILAGVTGIKPSQITKGFWDIWSEGYTKFLEKLPDMISSGLANSISAGLIAGIRTGFQKGANFGNVAASLSGAVLETVGAVAIQIGEATLAVSVVMQKIKEAIIGWNPVAGVAASLALIALGAALEGAGGRIASNSPVVGGGGFAGMSGMPQIIDRGFIGTTSSAAAGVTPQRSVTQHITVIGTDPKAWRQIQAQLDANAARSGRD